MLSRTTFLPFGPRVTWTVSASLLQPFSIFFLAFWPYEIFLEKERTSGRKILLDFVMVFVRRFIVKDIKIDFKI